jgi:hypothetical protein
LALLSSISDASLEDCSLVEHCFGIWLVCAARDGHLLSDVLALPLLDTLSLKALFCGGEGSATIRQAFARTVGILCDVGRPLSPSESAFRQHIVDLLLSQLSSDDLVWQGGGGR